MPPEDSPSLPVMGSSHSSAGSSSIPTLPNECILLILRQCQGSTLKNTRLCSKAFATLTDPLLWRDLRLVPNLDALGSIKHLMKASFAVHVQRLIYDISWEHLIDDFRIKAEQPASKQLFSVTPGKEKYTCSKILLHAIRNQIRSGEDAAAEVACLTPLLLVLPNLKELAVKDCATAFGPIESIPFYYSRVCKDAAISPTDLKLQGRFSPSVNNSSHARNFLLAAYSTGRRFDYVDLHALSWHTFFRLPTELSQPQTLDFKVRQILFSGLRQLDLAFKGAPSRDPDSHLVPLRDLLKSCERIEGLSLSFSSIVNRRYANDHRSYSYLAPLLHTSSSSRPLLPRLRDLFLGSAFCTQQELLLFLATHTPTLRHVSLSNISLLRNESKDSRGCWVQVIKGMKTSLRLNTVYFSGWLSNGGRQIWHISEDGSDDERLRPAVVRYVLNHGSEDCPLESVAIMPDQEDVEKPNTEWFEGDWTWTMTYASSKSRGEAIQSGSDLFTKHVPLDSDDWALANPSFWKTPYKKTYPAYTMSGSSKTPTPNSSDMWTDESATAHWDSLLWKNKDKFIAKAASWSGIDLPLADFGTLEWPPGPAHSGSGSTNLSGSNKTGSHSASHSSVSDGGGSHTDGGTTPDPGAYPDLTMEDFVPDTIPQSSHTSFKPSFGYPSDPNQWTFTHAPPNSADNHGNSTNPQNPHMWASPMLDPSPQWSLSAPQTAPKKIVHKNAGGGPSSIFNQHSFMASPQEQLPGQPVAQQTTVFGYQVHPAAGTELTTPGPSTIEWTNPFAGQPSSMHGLKW